MGSQSWLGCRWLQLLWAPAWAVRASRLPALEQGLGFWFLALQSKAERLFWLSGGPALQNFPNKSLGLFLTDIFWRDFPPAGREGLDLLIFQKFFIQTF